MCDEESGVLPKMEVSVRNSKLKVFVADRLIRELKKNKIQAADVFEIVLVDDDELLRFITCEYLKSRDVKSHKIANVLSAVYDKTMLLNVNAPKCVEVMEAYLVDYQYSREVNGGMETSSINKLADKERLVIIEKCVTIILEHAKPADYYQCDDKFLFLLRTLSKHLFLLGPKEKKNLKDVDNIQYCLSEFYLIQKQPTHMLRLFINKVMIIQMLTQFQGMLRNETVPGDAFFCDLERDTLSIKHYVALTNIYEHIKLVEDIDVEASPITGPLAIRRTLHILGEFTKDTDATKSISTEMSAQLKTMHNSLLGECAQKLRNRLSHNYSFYRLRHLDNLEPSYYKKIQQELKSLKLIFHSIIRLHLNQAMARFGDTVYNCENSVQVQSLLQYMKKVDFILFPDKKHHEHITNAMNELTNTVIPELLPISPDDELHSQIIATQDLILAYVDKSNDWLHVTDYASSFYELTHSMKYHTLENLKHFTKIFRQRFELFYSEYLTEFRIIYWELKVFLDTLLDRIEYKSLRASINAIVTSIQENFQCLLQMEYLFLHLDDDKSNPIFEWENLKYMDELYSQLGVKEEELKGHEKYSKASVDLMMALKKNTSIFQIDKKIAALGKYFQSLDRDMANELEILREAEKAEVQKVLEEKLQLFENLLTGDLCSGMALTMQFLEVLEILNEKNLKDNLHQLDERAPIPCGRNLRNSIGHLNMSYHVFNYDSGSMIRCTGQNIIALCKRKDQFKIFGNRKKTIKGAPIEKCNLDDELRLVDVQELLFDAIKCLDLTSFEDAIAAGAILQGKNHQNQNVLEMCINSNFNVFEQYGKDKSLLSPSDLEFIKWFLDIIPSHLFLNVDFDKEEVPKDIVKQAEEANDKGERDKLETDILAIACSTGSIETVKRMLECEEKFNMNRITILGTTPLTSAAFFGSKEITVMLLEALSEGFELSYLFCYSLAIYNDINLFKLAITKCHDINTVFKENRNHTILSMAIWGQCDLPIIVHLIEKGAKLDHRLSDGSSILKYSVLQNRVDLLHYFLEKELLDLNPSSCAVSPLNWACENGLISVVEVLLKSQIQIHDLNRCFITATCQSFTGIVEMLLTYRLQEFIHFERKYLIGLIKAAASTKNYVLLDLFLMKIRLTEPECLNQIMRSIFLKDIIIFEMLSKHGDQFPLTKELEKEWGFLHCAVHVGSLEIAKKLIELGHDYTTNSRQTEEGNITVLQSAVVSPFQNYRVLQYLLTLENLDLNATYEDGKTALFNAILKGKIEEAYLLLKNGADVSIRSTEGDTLLHAACFTGDLELLKMLVRFGAASQVSMKTENNVTPIVVAQRMRHQHLLPFLQTLQLQQEMLTTGNEGDRVEIL